MAEITFGELLQAAQKLEPEQKAALVYSLQANMATQSVQLSREQTIAQLQVLRAAGAFKNVESLRGKYARAGVEVSDEELSAYLRQVGTQWEQELDEPANSD